MSAVKLVAVFVENRPGQTAKIAGMLADAGINVRWVTIANSGQFGVMKFLVGDADHAARVLHEHGVMVSLVEALAVSAPDEPGQLRAVAACLALRGINLDNASGFVAGGRAVIVIETHEIPTGRVALAEHGFHALTQEELLGL
jgi:hypothetical protein